MINQILPNTQAIGKQAAPGREEAAACLQMPSVVGEIDPNVYDIVSGYENPSSGWESYQVRDLVRTQTENWVFGLANWKSFLSLTFRDEKTPDVALSLFKWFIRQNNEHAFGKHYTRTVGHSYFSYVFGLEYQTRDVVHFHALVDKPIDFAFVHKTWGERCGYAWIDGNLKSKAAAVNYVCKYCVKGGQIEAFVNKDNQVPKIRPDWWRDESKPNVIQVVSQPALFAGAAPDLSRLWQYLADLKGSSKKKPDASFAFC